MRFLPVLIFIIIWLTLPVNGQSSKPLTVIRANKPVADIRVGTKFSKGNWSILPEARPDVFEAQIEGSSVPVTFITDSDSLRVTVKPGDVYPFVVLLNGRDSAFTEIRGVAYTPPARFSEAYKKANTGATTAEIPEVYELVNILMTLTPTFKGDSGIVSRQQPYYGRLMAHFAPFANHAAVALIDSLMKADRYFDIKMDAYSFGFDRRGRITRSLIYDRVSWGNTLLPYITRIQQFADKTNFRQFYRQNAPVYEGQIRAYRDSLNIAEMVRWLNGHFPGTRYNAFKIIWSPLVGHNQSAQWLEDNGFKEMQAHVNFPYQTQTGMAGFSARSNEIKRGNIVFTEINHAFINPEDEKPAYKEGIQTAFANLKTWAEGAALQNYGNPYSCFNEYMNWGLVSLRFLDYADKADREKLLTLLETMMEKRRGFRRFAPFNRFLVNLYQTRQPGTTIADLYPQIVGWFVANK